MKPAVAGPRDTTRSPVLAYLYRLAPGSRRTQASALDTAARLIAGRAVLAGAVSWESVTHGDVVRLRAGLERRYAPATANRVLVAVRGVMRAAWRLGLVDGDTLARVVDVPGFPERDHVAGRALEAPELAAVLAGLDALEGPRARRDAALVAVLAAGGLRIAEAAGLSWGDVDQGDAVTVTVLGKGGRERLVPLPPGASSRLRAHWSAAGEPTTGRVFPLSVRRLYAAVVRAAGRATVDATSPHDLRRTCATRLLGAGVDVLTVGAILGHRNPQTTKRYDRRPLALARAAIVAADVDPENA